MFFSDFFYHGVLLVVFGFWFFVRRVSNFVRSYSGSGLECPHNCAHSNQLSLKPLTPDDLFDIWCRCHEKCKISLEMVRSSIIDRAHAVVLGI